MHIKTLQFESFHILKGFQSYEAGEYIKDSYPNSSIHCYHYCCVQLIEHIFIIKKEYFINNKDSNYNKNSHDIRISKLITYLKSEYGNVQEINSALTKIKQTRNQADYQNSPLKTKEDAIKIKEKCDIFINYLKEKNIING